MLPKQNLEDMLKASNLPEDQKALVRRAATQEPPDGPCEFDGRLAVKGKFFKGNR